MNALRISAETAASLERELLGQWKRRIAIELTARYAHMTREFGADAVDNWIRRAMDAARSIGATDFNDLRSFVIVLFHVAEVEKDKAATCDFALMMASEEQFSAKRSLLGKAFGHCFV